MFGPDFGLAEAVEMSTAFGSLPTNLIIYGIEGKIFRHGKDVSPQVAIAIESVAAQIAEELLS